MKFENAKKGIKRVYNAEILSIIAGIIAIVAAVLILVLGTVNKEGKANITDVISLISLIVAGIIAIIAYFLNIVGIVNASKDSEDFKNALYVLIAGIVVSLLSTILSKKFPSLSSGLNITENVCELLVSYYIINGCTSIAHQIGKADVEESGKRTMRLFITVWIISIAIQALGKIIERVSKTQVLSIIAGLLAIVALVLGLVCYIIFLKLLRKTIDIL
jgi:hypothetical protein